MSKPPRKAAKHARPKKLLDLKTSDCRWPIGEPRQEDFHFCGKPRLADRPFCEPHWRMAFQPSRPRLQTPAIAPPGTAKAA